MRINNRFTWAISAALCVFAGPAAAARTYLVDTLSDTPNVYLSQFCQDAQGRCSLRGAIQAANYFSDTDTIEFSVAGVIQIDSSLAMLLVDAPVIIKGQTAPGYAGMSVDLGDAAPRVYLDGDGLPNGIGLGFLENSTGSSVTALGVINFSYIGIYIGPDSEKIKIDSCYIGVRGSGLAAGNSFGIYVQGNENKIGRHVGLVSQLPPVFGVVGRGNVISGNSQTGLWLEGSDNIIGGNRIGTRKDGTGIRANNMGVGLNNANNNQIGGVFLGESFGNLIAGNTGKGIWVLGDGNEIYANGVGVGVPRSGQVSSANGSTGIEVIGDGNIIGSTELLAGNTITDNQTGIIVDGPSNVISGNIFGLPQQGFRNVDDGIRIKAGSGNKIEDNNISYNGGQGIELLAASDSTSISDNIIGVALASNDDTGNLGNGVRIAGNSNMLLGNLIGRNGLNGIYITNGSNNVIGSNQIGVDSESKMPLLPMSVGNLADGVAVAGGNGNNIVYNDIAFNHEDGVQVTGDSYKTAILRNLMSNNDGLGINLGIDVATANDDGDDDSGPNNLQNYPKLINVTQQGDKVKIKWLVDSLDSETVYPIKAHFFLADNASSGEGAVYLGSDSVAAPQAVLETILDLPPSALIGGSIVATATDNAGQNNTSEFSPARGFGDLIFKDGFDN